MATHICRISVAVRLSVLVIHVFCSAGRADTKDTRLEPTAFYANEPDHLWNRLHAALFVRTGPDGKVYGIDRLEPLLWSDSTHLLQRPSSERALAVLQEFDRK